ncbi:homeobox-leucine zipper protein ROC8-like [Solanum pennellii]|uniref:Homeobox-leucine zipper protein ROC8-like n=1 Tax=Solanum pennellii TaxID=28526 RepID=A0ABM1V864_SOLPN|nr:homeobox-leucine zipper protein ROC8-like [Solanum pennellii]
MTNLGKKHVGESSTSQNKANKKKKRFRLTVEQIQQVKDFLKKCPHPDKDQLIQISEEVGLKPKKIKNWIYNNKTQEKTQVDKSANKTLRTENEKLRSENIAMKEAMKKIICPQCDSERASNLENLKAENQRLTDKILWYSILLGGENF